MRFVYLFICAFSLVSPRGQGDSFVLGPIDPQTERAIQKRIGDLSQNGTDLYKYNLKSILVLATEFDSVRRFLYELHQASTETGIKFFDQFFVQYLSQHSLRIDSISALAKVFHQYTVSDINFQTLGALQNELVASIKDSVILRSSHPSFTELKDLHPAQVDELLALMDDLRKNPDAYSKELVGQRGGVLLLKPSTRTRVSSELALEDLGAKHISLSAEQSQFSMGEPLSHTLLALHATATLNYLFFRGYEHEEFVRASLDSPFPLINALTNDFHPLQALADASTLKSYFGVEEIEGKEFLFMGDGRSNELQSLMFILPQLGLKLHVVTPEEEEYTVRPTLLADARARISKFGLKGEVVVSHNPQVAVQNADVVYVDSFRVMEATEAANAIRVKRFTELGFQLDENSLLQMKRDAIVMHAMPIHEGEEVSSRIVVEGSHSLMIAQAKARVLSAKAVLLWINRNLRADIKTSTLSCMAALSK